MKNDITTYKYNSGFTLIEMIVTVSIVSILASIAVPSFTSMIERNKATTATNEMVSALLLARSEALKRRNNVTVCTSIDQTTCAGNGEKDFANGWIVFVDCDKDRVVDAAVDCGNTGLEAEKVVKAQLGEKGMTVNKGGDADKAHYFTYNYTGRADLATTFNVKKVNTSTVLKEITVARTGRISVK